MSKSVSYALFAAILLAGASTSTAEPTDDWPGFRGAGTGAIDTRSGRFARLDEIGLNVSWRRSLGSGYSGISVAGGRAVTLFSDGTSQFAVALDAETGRELWRYRFDATYPGHDGSHEGPISTPVIDTVAGRVFGLSRRGRLYARIEDEQARFGPPSIRRAPEVSWAVMSTATAISTSSPRSGAPNMLYRSSS